MIMYLLSMHLTMSGERLVVWTPNWVIIRDRDKSILARLKLSVGEEAHCNCSIDHINIVGLFFLFFFKAGSRHYVLTWIKGYQHQKWWKLMMLAEKSDTVEVNSRREKSSVTAINPEWRQPQEEDAAAWNSDSLVIFILTLILCDCCASSFWRWCMRIYVHACCAFWALINTAQH